MNGIVHASIEQISQHKARKKDQCICSKDAVIQQEKAGCDNEARQGWHKKPLFIARVFMVIAMNEVIQFFTPCGCRMVMKGEAV